MRFCTRFTKTAGARGVASRTAALAVALLVAGCNGAGEAAPADASGAATDAQRYELAGEVVEVRPAQRTVVVDHRAVAGFMEAMTMPFNVRQDWVLDTAEPGARIRATLVVDGDSSWLEDVVINKPAGESPAAIVLVPQPEPGDPVPATRLVDQDGLEMTLEEYDGRFWAFTFVYTTCPMEDFCPRISRNFAQAYRAIQADPERYGDALLLSVTVDPARDTPEVLREYGLKYLGEDGVAGFERWRFGRAEPRPLAELAEFTGLRFMPEEGEIVHSLRTLVVDPEGKMVKAFIGNTWETEQLLQTLEEAAAAWEDGSSEAS